jgi:CheY-like chemotaxis protein
MARKLVVETKAAARLRLTEEMLNLGHKIDRLETGPRRLEMLREQAALSDKREALLSTRH